MQHLMLRSSCDVNFWGHTPADGPVENRLQAFRNMLHFVGYVSSAPLIFGIEQVLALPCLLPLPRMPICIISHPLHCPQIVA